MGCGREGRRQQGTEGGCEGSVILLSGGVLGDEGKVGGRGQFFLIFAGVLRKGGRMGSVVLLFAGALWKGGKDGSVVLLFAGVSWE
jgi:hypothetical protein